MFSFYFPMNRVEMDLVNINASTINVTKLTEASEPWHLTTLIVTIILSIIVLLTVGGNVLILSAVLASTSLREPNHILIANLAVADLLLGTLVLPFSATLEVTGKWYFGAIFCDIWAAIDVLCCTASILSLCVISVDRYIGITRPLNYYSIVTAKRSSLLCVAVWISSLAISIGPLFGWKERDVLSNNDSLVCTVTTQPGYVLFSVSASFYLPTLVILGVYWRIYKDAIKQTKFLEDGVKISSNEITLRVHVGGNHQNQLVRKNCRTTIKHKNLIENRERTRTESAVAICDEIAQQIELEQICVESAEVNCPNSDENQDVRMKSNKRVLFENEEDLMSKNHRRGRKALSHTTNNGLSAKLFRFRRQKKAAKTLGIVVGAYLLCWFPFFVVLPVGALCSSCGVSETLFSCCFWLGYFNSCLNPFIYASTSREFKRAFSKILCSRKFKQPTLTRRT